MVSFTYYVIRKNFKILFGGWGNQCNISKNDVIFQISKNINGSIVTSVRRGSPAATSGLRQGDVVLMVNRSAVNSSAETIDAIEIAQGSGRTSVLLQVLRGGRVHFVAIPFA